MGIGLLLPPCEYMIAYGGSKINIFSAYVTKALAMLMKKTYNINNMEALP